MDFLFPLLYGMAFRETGQARMAPSVDFVFLSHDSAMLKRCSALLSLFLRFLLRTGRSLDEPKHFVITALPGQ